MQENSAVPTAVAEPPASLPSRRRMRRFLRSGAIAGAASALVFTIVHHLLISDIWFSLPIMATAGAMCGLCLAWTYGRLFAHPSLRSWVSYNLLFVGMFAFLGVASIAIYEPVTTVAVLLAANARPDELFGHATPLTATFTLVFAGFLCYRYGRTSLDYISILVTCVTLVLLLGLNVAVLGLVEIPLGSFYLIGELFALILVLNVVFAGGFWMLEQKVFVPK